MLLNSLQKYLQAVSFTDTPIKIYNGPNNFLIVDHGSFVYKVEIIENFI